MNFTAVRGFNAYAMFSAKIREAVKNREDAPKEPEPGDDYSRSIYAEPVDIVTISESARNAAALMASTSSEQLITIRENSPHLEFREWAKSARMGNVLTGSFTQKVPGSIMNDVISGSGITVGDDEEYAVSIDVQAAITVSGRNAEKARAIQDLLHSTPSGINWGMLLAKLPPQ